MTTTLTLEESLYQSVVNAAKSRGKSFGEFVSETLQSAVTDTTACRFEEKNGVLVAAPPEGTPAIDTVRVRQAIEESVF